MPTKLRRRLADAYSITSSMAIPGLFLATYVDDAAQRWAYVYDGDGAYRETLGTWASGGTLNTGWVSGGRCHPTDRLLFASGPSGSSAINLLVTWDPSSGQTWIADPRTASFSRLGRPHYLGGGEALVAVETLDGGLEIYRFPVATSITPAGWTDFLVESHSNVGGTLSWAGAGASVLYPMLITAPDGEGFQFAMDASLVSPDDGRLVGIGGAGGVAGVTASEFTSTFGHSRVLGGALARGTFEGVEGVGICSPSGVWSLLEPKLSTRSFWGLPASSPSLDHWVQGYEDKMVWGPVSGPAVTVTCEAQPEPEILSLFEFFFRQDVP